MGIVFSELLCKHAHAAVLSCCCFGGKVVQIDLHQRPATPLNLQRPLCRAQRCKGVSRRDSRAPYRSAASALGDEAE